jgi:hypothetical protein
MRTWKKPAAFLLCLQLFFSLVTDPAQAEEKLAAKLTWGLRFNTAAFNSTAADSLKLIATTPNFPAAQAGLQAGDLIVAVNHQRVRNGTEFRQATSGILPYTPTQFTIGRNGVELERVLVPRGILRLNVTPPERAPFLIPGAPENTPRPPQNPIEALDKINVLKQVIFDPQTKAVAIIGVYDRNYNTGPIPYLDLLKTAMAYPEPRFSIDPPQRRDELLPQRNAEGASIPLALDPLLEGHPGLEREREIYITELARQYGVTRAEYVALYNYLHFDNDTGAPPPELARIQEKMLRHLGFNEVADGYAVLIHEGPAAAGKVLALLGKRPGDCPGSMLVQAHFALLEKTTVDKQWLDRAKQQVAAGKVTEQAALTELQERLVPKTTIQHDPTYSVVVNALLRVVVIGKGVTILDSVQNLSDTTCDSILNSADNDVHSQLNRIMYEADYSLKSLSLFPERFSSIPAYTTWFEYNFANNISGHSYARFWFEPAKVTMAISPDRTVVSFGAAEMVSKSEDMLNRGTPSVFETFYRDLNVHFDSYARIMPAFHKLREATKIVALARWLRSQGLQIDLQNVAQERWNSPGKIECLRFRGIGASTVERGLKVNSIVGIAGGVNFKSNRQWTTITTAPETQVSVIEQLNSSTHLGELAAQAAEAGDLEQASYLATLSAQAMTGTFSREDLGPLGIVVPKPSPNSTATVVQVQAQKLLLQELYRQLTSPETPGTASNLARISGLFAQIQSSSGHAFDVLYALNNGQLYSSPAPSAPPAPPAPVAQAAPSSPASKPTAGQAESPPGPKTVKDVSDHGCDEWRFYHVLQFANKTGVPKFVQVCVTYDGKPHPMGGRAEPHGTAFFNAAPCQVSDLNWTVNVCDDGAGCPNPAPCPN